MKRLLLAGMALVLLCSHDMFLKPTAYFLDPDAPAEIELVNGTFARSENVIARSRMADVSLLGLDARTRLDTTSWTERDSATVLNLTTGAPGTYVVGVSTLAREIALAADAFNAYLEHDGVVDMLEARRRDQLLGEDAVERYAKHVKTIFQVGDRKTGDWQTPLGYPIEFVPLSNPYELHPGDELGVRLLLRGQPLANQLVLVGTDAAAHDHDHADGAAHDHDHADAAAHDHDHADGTTHDHDHADGAAHDHAEATDHVHDANALEVRTDAEGVARFPVTGEGVWHLRTIHMTTVDEPGLTHESNWATLTFGVSHAHSHADGAHDHDHEHDGGGLPGYVYWLGSLAVVGGLFVYFNRGR